MDSAINWNEAEAIRLRIAIPTLAHKAVGDGVFGRLLAAIDTFTAVPGTFIDGGDHVVVLGRYGVIAVEEAIRQSALFFRDEVPAVPSRHSVPRRSDGPGSGVVISFTRAGTREVVLSGANSREPVRCGNRRLPDPEPWRREC